MEWLIGEIRVISDMAVNLDIISFHQINQSKLIIVFPFFILPLPYYPIVMLIYIEMSAM